MSLAKTVVAVVGLALVGFVVVVLVRAVRAMMADNNIYERMWR